VCIHDVAVMVPASSLTIARLACILVDNPRVTET
jgi:hypothetical protein